MPVLLVRRRGRATGAATGTGFGSAAGADALLRTPAGRIPSLRHVDRPELAGAHPADGRPGGGGRTPAASPAYIRRDVEPQLCEALRRAGFVLLVGEAAAGKSRLAHEAARSLFPRHAFVRPLGRAALPLAVRTAARRRRSVLWLDDLEDFLGAGGLTTALLAGLSTAPPGRRVVLATLRTEEYRRFDAREESRLTGSDRDAWRTQRDVLRRAEVVRLARHWSPEERRRAADHRQDPRINAALRAGERFGIAEVLSAGPRLLAAWQHAWAPGANPRGAAVVAAAVDCRRAGLHRPVSRERLCELHVPHLAARGGGDLRPEPFAEAMDWACAAGYATSGLLVGDRSQGYAAFDYLIDTPGLAPVPDHLWRTLVTRVTPAEAYDMGLLAHQEGRSRRAAEALSRARRGGVTGADFLLAITLGDAGRTRWAAAELAGITRRRENRLGPRHPDTLAARHQRAHFTGQSGDSMEAARQLARLLADRLPVQGAEHPQVLATRRSLIWYGAGDPARIEQQSAELLADAERLLGPDDPHTLAVRSTRASLAAPAGRTAEALAAWESLAADRSRVMGPDHPHTIPRPGRTGPFPERRGPVRRGPRPAGPDPP